MNRGRLFNCFTFENFDIGAEGVSCFGGMVKYVLLLLKHDWFSNNILRKKTVKQVERYFVSMTCETFTIATVTLLLHRNVPILNSLLLLSLT